MTGRVWIQGTWKAVGVLGAFDNVVNVTLIRHDYKPTGLDKAVVPSSSTHDWKCQGLALVPRQTVGVCKDMQVLHLERSRTQAQQLLGCCPSAAADWWSIGHQTHRLGTRKEIEAMGVPPVCAPSKTCEPWRPMATALWALSPLSRAKFKVPSSFVGRVDVRRLVSCSWSRCTADCCILGASGGGSSATSPPSSQEVQ